MIRVSRLDGSKLIINCELVEFVEHTPDTVISLVTGRKFVVRESTGEVVRRVMDYKRGISQRRWHRRRLIGNGATARLAARRHLS
ncbi:MAG: flagellar FlbD family protein [Chloroflexota bacterium]